MKWLDGVVFCRNNELFANDKIDLFFNNDVFLADFAAKGNMQYEVNIAFMVFDAGF